MMKLILNIMLSFGSLPSELPFDFHQKTPIDFLDFLCANSEKSGYIVDSDLIPENWITDIQLEHLIERIGSHRITTPVYSINCSYSWYKFQIKTTEGVEALFLIDAVRKNKKYAASLSSHEFGKLENGIFYPDSVLVIEVQQWYDSR